MPALGVIRTILDGALVMDITKYIKIALKALPVQRDCADEINEFFIQRLIIFLSDKYNKNILEACALNNPLADITDYVKRVETVSGMNKPQLLEKCKQGNSYN